MEEAKAKEHVGELNTEKINGDVKPALAEEPLSDFVVIDDITAGNAKVDSGVKKDPSVEVKAETTETCEKASSVKDGAKENVTHENDHEKNGDSLILTADEDLEQVVASPKKSTAESAPIDADQTKAASASSTTLQPSTESPSATKTTNEKAPHKNMRVIWVSNITKTIKATDLKQHLSKAGKVTTAKIVTDGKRCFGYVLMENANDAAECVKTLNNTTIDDKNISLSFDKPTKTNQSSSKANESCSDGKNQETSKRPEKRHRSPSKNRKDDKSSPESKIKPEGSSDAAESDKPAEKKVRSRSSSRERYLRERNERDRLKKRIMEEERKYHEVRMRQIDMDQRQREKEFKLEQERRKLQMERELFEKQKREWTRINEERRKLEKARLEVEQQRAKLEEDLKKERMKRKSPEIMQSVVSKISDPSKKVMKIMKRDDFKSYVGPTPPPPKLGGDYDHGRKSDDRKMARASGVRKIDVIDRKFYPDSVDHKKHYSRKPDFVESKPYIKRYTNEREDEHRAQWSPPMTYGGSGVGSSSARYQDTSSSTSQQFGGGPTSSSRNSSGYYYHPPTSNQEFNRYNQVPNRKY